MSKLCKATDLNHLITINRLPSAGSPLAAGLVDSAANCGAAWLGQIGALILLASPLLPKSLFPTRGFRPDF